MYLSKPRRPLVGRNLRNLQTRFVARGEEVRKVQNVCKLLLSNPNPHDAFKKKVGSMLSAKQINSCGKDRLLGLFPKRIFHT